MIQQLVLSTNKKLEKGKQDQGLNAQTVSTNQCSSKSRVGFVITC